MCTNIRLHLQQCRCLDQLCLQLSVIKYFRLFDINGSQSLVFPLFYPPTLIKTKGFRMIPVLNPKFWVAR